MRAKPFFTFLLTVLLFVAQQGMAATPPSDQLATVTLQLKWKHQFQFAGYYAAVEKGFYRERGLDVRLRELEEGENPVDVVLSGAAQYGVGTSELVLFRAGGKPVVLLAPVFQHSPLILLATKSSGITSIHDLQGKKVAMEAQAAELAAYLKSEGLSLKDIVLQPHPFNPAPLIAGEIAAMSAYATDEPFVMREKGIEPLILSPRASGIDFYGDSLFTSEELVGRDPVQVRAFIDASIRGWKYAMENPEEIIAVIYDRYSQRHSLEHLRFEAKETQRLILPGIVELGYSNPGRWQFIADTYLDLGLLTKPYPVAPFLFERNPKPRPYRFYAVIAGLALLALVCGWVALRLFRLNQDLHLQIARRSAAEEALRHAEQRYRMMVEQTPFPVAISDLSTGDILFANPRFFQMFALDKGKRPLPMTEDFYWDINDRLCILESLKSQNLASDCELRLKRANGAPFWAYLCASLIHIDGKDALCVAFNDIDQRKLAEEERDRLIAELQDAIAQVKTLSGLIPICAWCKKVRNDSGFWQQVELYVQQRTDAQFSHGICPDCREKFRMNSE